MRHVPHAQRLVVGGGEQVAAARVPSRAAHPVVVSHQRRQTLPRAHVPDLPPLCNVSITTKTFKLYITVFKISLMPAGLPPKRFKVTNL